MLASMHHLQYWIWQLGCLLALCLIHPFPEYLQYYRERFARYARYPGE